MRSGSIVAFGWLSWGSEALGCIWVQPDEQGDISTVLAPPVDGLRRRGDPFLYACDARHANPGRGQMPEVCVRALVSLCPSDGGLDREGQPQ